MFNPNDHLMDLKGKSYLQVAHRVLWLNEDVKEGLVARFGIHSDLVSDTSWNDEKRKRTVREAVFKATVTLYDEDGNVIKQSSGWGSETDVDFADYREKAETKAIGRAVALVGYGTQHAPEFDEGERASPFLDEHGNRGPVGPSVVDAPVRAVKAGNGKAPPAKPAQPASAAPAKAPVTPPVQNTDPMGNQATGDSKTEVLTWLRDHSKHEPVMKLLQEALKGHPSGTRVSDLPEATLHQLQTTASQLLSAA